MTPHRPTLRSLSLASVLSPMPNMRIHGFAFGYAKICYRKIITIRSFSDTMSRGTLDTRRPLGDIL